MKLPILKFSLFLLTLAIPRSLLAAPQLIIDSPTTMTSLKQGESFILKAHSSESINFERIFPTGSFGAPFQSGTGPFEFLLQVPIDFPLGQFGQSVSATYSEGNQTVTLNTDIAILVVPSQPVQSLKWDFNPVDLGFVGDQIRVVILAGFTNKEPESVNGLPTLTFKVDDPTVASIKDGGLIVALAPGQTRIDAIFQNPSGSTPEKVINSTTVIVPKTIPGDLNGDHRVTGDDYKILLSRKDLELVPGDGRDLNGDGSLDIKDSEQFAALCKGKSCETIVIPTSSPTPTEAPTLTPTQVPTLIPTVAPTLIATATALPTQTATPTATGTVSVSNDLCPDDSQKTTPGKCGCGKPESDTNKDFVIDCGSPKLFSKILVPEFGKVSTNKRNLSLVLEKFKTTGLKYELVVSGKAYKKKSAQLIWKANSGKISLPTAGGYQVKFRVTQLIKKKSVNSRWSAVSVVTVN